MASPSAPDGTPREPSVVDLLDAPVPEPASSASARVFPTFEEPLFTALREEGYRRLVLQVPAGLIRNAHDLAAGLRASTGAEVRLLSRACFGACDLPTADEGQGAQAAVVLGHSPIPNVRLRIPTFFVEMRHAWVDPERVADRVLGAGVPRRLGLVASIQHLDLVVPLVDALGRRGYAVEVGTGDRRLSYPAQALGCNYSGAQAVAPRVEGYLFLGTGRFHPVGLALATDRPVWSVDPLQETAPERLDRARLVRDRLLLIARAQDAQRWGILASTFVGQDRVGMARVLRARAVRHGKDAEILLFDRLDPRDLEGRALDAYVNTACPRIAIDDAGNYPRPMLTPPEFLMALKELPMEPYRFDTYH